MDAQADRLRAIIKTQSEIAAADLDSAGVMQLVAKRAQELTGASAGVIEVPEHDEMVYTVTAGEATPYLGIRMDRDSSLSGLALDLDQVLYCDDTEMDPRIDRAASRRVKARSMIAVPAASRRRCRRGAQGLLTAIPAPSGPSMSRPFSCSPSRSRPRWRMRHLFEVKEKESRTDALTGLFNRRAYEERLVIEAARSARYRHPLAVCDLRPRRVQGRQRRARPPGGRRGAPGSRQGDRFVPADRRCLPDRGR